MSEYRADIEWTRAESRFKGGQYSRGHTWRFDGGIEVPASASPHVVPPPHSVVEAVDPEEAFVAALASCHMLWFLSIAAERGFIVERYSDRAEGVMRPNEVGRIAITDVSLRPEATFESPEPTWSEVEAMHHAAHDKCYIANSVRTNVSCEPVRAG